MAFYRMLKKEKKINHKIQFIFGSGGNYKFKNVNFTIKNIE